MPSKRFLFLAFLSAMFCAPASSKEQDENPEPIQHVYAGLLKLTEIRDSVQARYAMRMVGENHFTDPKKDEGIPRIRRVHRLRSANESKSVSYIADGHVMSSKPTDRFPVERQYWVELFGCGYLTKARSTSMSSQPYKVRKKGESINNFLSTNRIRVDYFDPFDSLVLHPMFIRNPVPNDEWIEKIFFNEAELVTAEETSEGNVKSKWIWRFRVLHFEIELLQSRQLEYLPVDVKYKSLSKEMPDQFGHTRIGWKQYTGSKDRFTGRLPYRIEAATGKPYGTEIEQHYYVLDWIVGEDIGDDAFECDQIDYRLVYAKYFDQDFDFSIGRTRVPAAPFEVPLELFTDFDPTKPYSPSVDPADEARSRREKN